MTKISKLEAYLNTGATVTAKQITSRFGLSNPHDAIYQLRQQGNCIYSNPSKLKDGTETTKYRVRAPSKRMVALVAEIFGSELFQGRRI
jgi:hypothetical protein